MKTLEEIEQLFTAQIHVPSAKPENQIYFCPVGLVGAGKTTVTKPISERLNLVRVSSDELRKLLIENGHNYDSLKAIAMRVIEKFVKDGYSIALDMDCGNVEVIQLVKVVEQKYGGISIWVHVTASEEHIFEKFRKHEPTWLASDPQIMIDNYFAQKEKRLSENSQFNFVYTFDTSKNTVAEQIEEFLLIAKTF